MPFDLLLALDLLDFGRVGFCWISSFDRGQSRAKLRSDVGFFVGFRAALNMCPHRVGDRKYILTCVFVEWAVTGSNRRPLRCKCNALTGTAAPPRFRGYRRENLPRPPRGLAHLFRCLDASRTPAKGTLTRASSQSRRPDSNGDPHVGKVILAETDHTFYLPMSAFDKVSGPLPSLIHNQAWSRLVSPTGAEWERKSARPIKCIRVRGSRDNRTVGWARLKKCYRERLAANVASTALSSHSFSLLIGR
jgi:hypothetical protein